MPEKCNHCGSSEIEKDPARGDSICCNCGVVLENSTIVSDVQFEERGQGTRAAIGHFVASDSKGGATSFGKSFHSGIGLDSREVTLRHARQAICDLAQQLRLNQNCIETAVNFYKMALTRHLTRGRRQPHVVAACLYMTCRIENTPHLLIDFSEKLQADVYELGRTYLKLSQVLCINIPSMDPCLYILRFANRLELGRKTHEVSMTALRLVQRMKRDFIHSGRRPAGLCGAALLMAARLHGFNRTVGDIIKIVKVHETTLRKRLMEFGDTPSSGLTLEEFMTVDLEEEQDPPSFKETRKKDKERLNKMMEKGELNGTFNKMQQEIERELEAKIPKKRNRHDSTLSTCELDAESRAEKESTDNFISESTLGAIKGCISESISDEGIASQSPPESQGLGPPIASMGLAESLSEEVENTQPSPHYTKSNETGEIDLEGIDDAEIDTYILTDKEAMRKDTLWNSINAQYLLEKKAREEKKAKEEEGKPEKKKRKTSKKKNTTPANSAGEAIEKMLQEKKISSKINYDVLKNLGVKSSTQATEKLENPDESTLPSKSRKSVNTGDPVISSARLSRVSEKHNKKEDKTELSKATQLEETAKEIPEVADIPPDAELETGEDYEEDVEPENDEMSLAAMLNQNHEDSYYDDYDYDY